MVQCIMIRIIGVKTIMSRLFWCDATKKCGLRLIYLKQVVEKIKKAPKGLWWCDAKQRLAVAEDRLSLFDKGRHAFLLVGQGKG